MKLSALSLSTTLLTTLLSAEDIASCCAPYDYKVFSPCIDVTPSARICSCSYGLFVEASYLLWQGRLDNTAPCATTYLPENRVEDQRGSLHVHQLDFDWRSGCKVGVGYNFARDAWDLLLEWTYIAPKGDSYKKAPPDALGLIALQTDGIALDAAFVVSNQAQAEWNMHFNVLDLTLGRFFYLGRYFAVRPSAGLKWTYNTQNMSVYYTTNMEANSEDFKMIGDAISHFCQHHSAIGPRFGWNTLWTLFCNIDFIANFAFSLLANEMHTYTSSGLINLDTAPPSLAGTIFYRKRKLLTPVIECFLGIDWRHCFCEKYMLDIAIGYEMQLWTQQNQWTLFQPSANPSNLQFQGLTVTAGFGF